MAVVVFGGTGPALRNDLLFTSTALPPRVLLFSAWQPQGPGARVRHFAHLLEFALAPLTSLRKAPERYSRQAAKVSATQTREFSQ